MFILQLVSLLGALFALGAYWLVQTKRIEPVSYTYAGLNLFAAVLLIYAAVVQFNVGYFVLNLVWGIIAILGMRRRHNASR